MSNWQAAANSVGKTDTFSLVAKQSSSSLLPFLSKYRHTNVQKFQKTETEMEMRNQADFIYLN